MAVTLVALDFSRPVQPLFEQASRVGIVHSVFPKALNIVVADTLFVLLSVEAPRMPNSARLPAYVMEQLYRKLSPGMEVCIGDGRLSIPMLDLSIHLPRGAPWEPVPVIAARSWCRATVARHARLLARHLAERALPDGLAPLVKPLLLHQAAKETPLAKIALPLLRLLMDASRHEDMAGVEAAVRGLAGLGPGLTPSGDDTLGGFVGVIALSPSFRMPVATPLVGVPSLFPNRRNDRTGHPQGVSLLGFTREDGESLASLIVNTARPRTTILSATLLAHAARGELAEHVGELLTALTLPPEHSEAVLRAADRVLAYGACSGGDTLLGLLLGLQASGIAYPVDCIGEDHGHTGATQAEHVL